MNGLCWKLACAGLVCATGWLEVREAKAQSLGAPPSSVGTTGATSLAGTSVSTTPLSLPISTPAFGTGAANSGVDVAGNPIQGNIFANPFAAPFFYGSLMPGGTGATSTTTTTTSGSSTTSTTTTTAQGGSGLGDMQMGMMMMATQNPNGVGSGVMSGARSSRTRGVTKTAAAPASTRARTIATPAGLATRYFNRRVPHSAIPKSFFDRQTRYFP